jgi:methionyl aminopeptidase
VRDVPVGDEEPKRLLDFIKSEYLTLPFTIRWLEGVLPPFKLRYALSKLISLKAITGYPVLVEASGMKVAQAEHTVIVTKREVIVTTA